MSMPNDPEDSKPAAPQSAPQQAGTTAPYPYATTPPQTPGYAPLDRGALPPFNVMALITFIGAFVIPVVGIVCGHITLAEYRKGLPERGREYAKAGLILGYIFTAIWVVLAIIWIVFAFTHLGHASGVGQGGGNFQRFGGGSGGSGGFQFPTPGATPGS